MRRSCWNVVKKANQLEGGAHDGQTKRGDRQTENRSTLCSSTESPVSYPAYSRDHMGTTSKLGVLPGQRISTKKHSVNQISKSRNG
eukprot:scaffold2253_cov119-Cylindrotheca_fusiformis.AAC.8